jgi:hypothetical protein
VVWTVSADLAERPGGSSLEVILWLVDEGILEWSYTLRNNNSHSKRIIESRDVTKGHDTWKSSVTLGFRDVINGSGSTTRVDNELGQFCSLLCNFSNAGSSVLSDLDIHILKAVEDSWEDFSLNNNFGKINCMLSNLSKALADISLQLSIWVRDQSGKIWDSSLVDNGLGEFFSVFGNFSESSSRDSLKSELWLLNTEDEKTNGTSINNSLGKLVIVLGNARKSEGGSLLNGWIELFKAVNESIKSS